VESSPPQRLMNMECLYAQSWRFNVSFELRFLHPKFRTSFGESAQARDRGGKPDHPLAGSDSGWSNWAASRAVQCAVSPTWCHKDEIRGTDSQIFARIPRAVAFWGQCELDSNALVQGRLVTGNLSVLSWP
jgi:hypothetical protein